MSAGTHDELDRRRRRLGEWQIDVGELDLVDADLLHVGSDANDLDDPRPARPLVGARIVEQLDFAPNRILVAGDRGALTELGRTVSSFATDQGDLGLDRVECWHSIRAAHRYRFGHP
jgi:hypothetical protein